jgi:hypothetical protein
MDIRVSNNVSNRRGPLGRFIDRICQSLELTRTQQENARDRYESVGEWLAKSPSNLLHGVTIYPQGSIALGTTVRPIGHNEHDVDLVCFMPALSEAMPPDLVKCAVGERLRENAYYAKILEEKRRCWRLNFAGEFHMDITPSIQNVHCQNGGELVPDKALKSWKPTNPRGYRDLFERRASIKPNIARLRAEFAADSGSVEALPTLDGNKDVLRRAVQVAKRHRDIYFLKRDCDLAPISVIVTTLLARSYEMCATNRVYDNGYDLLLDTVHLMKVYVETDVVNGHKHWLVRNETTEGENFAEKWNSDTRLPKAFYDWHDALVTTIETTDAALGLDELSRQLSASFGEEPATAALRSFTDTVSAGRVSKTLGVGRGVGLATAASTIIPVRANTFFGRSDRA